MAKITDILLLLLLFGATSATKTKCHELTGTVELTKDPDICEVESGISVVGHTLKPVTLDFSKADETALNTFLAKFNKIAGAIVMNGNEQVTTLNFGSITEFDIPAAPDGKFIFIRNNPKLAKIDWNSAVDVIDRDVVMLIYNNPLLAATSLDTLHTVLNGKKKIQHHVQRTELNECQFEYPLKMTTPDPSKYIAPSAEFLKNCKKIKGDFIVENAKLAGLGPFELGADACLRLVNVDMKDVKITATANTGSETCKDGIKSEITGNPNVCGDELETLHKYYKGPTAVAVKMDNATCTKPCSSGQLSSLYILCKPPTTPSPTTPATTETANITALVGKQQPNSPKPPPSDSKPSKDNTGLIVGIICGVLVVAAFIALFLVLWKKNCLPCGRRRRRCDDDDDDKEKKKKEPKKSNKKKRRNKPKKKEIRTSRNNSSTTAPTSGSTEHTKEVHENELQEEVTATPKTDKSTGTTEEIVAPAKDDKPDHHENMLEGGKKTASKETVKPAGNPAKKKKTSSSTLSHTESTSKEKTLNNDAKMKTATFKNGITEFGRWMIANLNPKDLRTKCNRLRYNGGEGIDKYRQVQVTDDNGVKHTKNKLILEPNDRKATNALVKEDKKRYKGMPVVENNLVILEEKKSEPIMVSANKVHTGFKTVYCAEGPLKQTLSIFWRMIIQGNVTYVVMLCNFLERDNEECLKEKCFQYLPLHVDDVLIIDKNITVKCLSEEPFMESGDLSSAVIIHRVLEVTVKNKEPRKIDHYHFTQWPDYGVPKYQDAKKLISLDDAESSLVHCSAGVGRSGVFIIINKIMDMLMSGQTVIDIFQLVKELRQQRAYAVYEYCQFAFIHYFFLKLAMEYGNFNEEEMARAQKVLAWLELECIPKDSDLNELELLLDPTQEDSEYDETAEEMDPQEN